MVKSLNIRIILFVITLQIIEILRAKNRFNHYDHLHLSGQWMDCRRRVRLVVYHPLPNPEKVGPSNIARSLALLYFLLFISCYFLIRCNNWDKMQVLTSSLQDSSGWRHRSAIRRRALRHDQILNLIHLNWIT